MLEQESCNWIAPWKIGGKTTYLRKQCEQIKGLYGVEGISPLEREMMRINGICVLSPTRKGVSFNFTNELYNAWLKIVPATPFIDTAVLRSCHTVIQKQCGN